MVAADLVRESPDTADGAAATARGLGRPQQLLEVNARRHHAVGVKLGSDRVTAVLTDLAGQIQEQVVRASSSHDPGSLLDAAAELVRDLLQPNPEAQQDTAGVGIGVSGHVDADSGMCRYSGILGWRDVPIAAELQARLNLPVVVNNDVNALVIAEWWFGLGRHCRSFAVVTVGEGIGCGLILNDQPHTGHTGLAGEFGHIPVIEGGPSCRCGRTGCVEALAGDNALTTELARRGGPHVARIEELVALLSDDGWERELASAVLRRGGAALGRGLATLVNLLNLERIMLSGGPTVFAEPFRAAMWQSVDAHSFSSGASDTQLTFSRIDDAAWARGAACLVISEAFLLDSPLSVWTDGIRPTASDLPVPLPS